MDTRLPRMLRVLTLASAGMGMSAPVSGIAPVLAQSQPRVLKPADVDDRRNSIVPVSGTRILGMFAGDPKTEYDRDAVYVCLPAAAPTGADLFVSLGSVDGVLDARYRFASADLTAGGLVRLDLDGRKLKSSDFAAYRNAEVATLVYLARSPTDSRIWLVAQFDRTIVKRPVHLQLNADPAGSSVVTSDGAKGLCSPIANVSGRPSTTLAFTAMCEFMPTTDGLARLVRHQGLVSVDDLALEACGAR